jgi:opacity protein-like surface antigen
MLTNAVQVGLGARYMFSKNLSVDCNIRYVSAGSYDVETSYTYNGVLLYHDIYSMSMSAVNAQIGLKYWY